MDRMINWFLWELERAAFLLWLEQYIAWIITFAIIFAIIGGIVAYFKRHTIIGWILLCFFFGLLPLLILLVIPKRKTINRDEIKKCSFCAEDIKKDANICKYCKNTTSEKKHLLSNNETKCEFEVLYDVNLRKAASDSALIVCELKKGTIVISNMYKQFDFYYVTALDEKKGWIQEKYLKLKNHIVDEISENIQNKQNENKIQIENYKVELEILENVYLRKSANENASFICELNKGTIVYSNMYKQFNYYYIITIDGDGGWILEKYLKQINIK
jgi:SH3-like domain-containing protein